jgi:hypothetical protein
MKPNRVRSLPSIIKQINMGVARLENYLRKAKAERSSERGRSEMGFPSREAYNESISCSLFKKL